jgi:hypothetical protein
MEDTEFTPEYEQDFFFLKMRMTFDVALDLTSWTHHITKINTDPPVPVRYQTESLRSQTNEMVFVTTFPTTLVTWVFVGAMVIFAAVQSVVLVRLIRAKGAPKGQYDALK